MLSEDQARFSAMRSIQQIESLLLDNSELNRTDRAYIFSLIYERALKRRGNRVRDLVNDQATLILAHLVNDQATPFLFLGGMGAVSNVAALNLLGITNILCVATGLHLDLICLGQNGIQVGYIKAKDKRGYPIREDFARAFAYIDRVAATPNGRVLVNCRRGKSRSATIVTAYIMQKHRISLAHALLLVAALRPHIKPNEGFMRALEAFERDGAVA